MNVILYIIKSLWYNKIKIIRQTGSNLVVYSVSSRKTKKTEANERFYYKITIFLKKLKEIGWHCRIQHVE